MLTDFGMCHLRGTPKIKWGGAMGYAAPETFEEGAELCSVGRSEVLCVADHEFDCVGAKAAGMRTVFIDRRRRPFAAWPHQPDLIVESMTKLADAML